MAADRGGGGFAKGAALPLKRATSVFSPDSFAKRGNLQIPKKIISALPPKGVFSICRRGFSQLPAKGGTFAPIACGEEFFVFQKNLRRTNFPAPAQKPRNLCARPHFLITAPRPPFFEPPRAGKIQPRGLFQKKKPPRFAIGAKSRGFMKFQQAPPAAEPQFSARRQNHFLLSAVILRFGRSAAVRNLLPFGGCCLFARFRPLWQSLVGHFALLPFGLPSVRFCVYVRSAACLIRYRSAADSIQFNADGLRLSGQLFLHHVDRNIHSFATLNHKIRSVRNAVPKGQNLVGVFNDL